MHPQPTSTSTQPRDRRAYSNLKHGLTGRVYLFGEAEQAAYDQLSRGLHESLTPANELECQLVKSLVDDRWRLARAATLESAIFAEAAEKFAADPEQATGDPDLDRALSDGRTWIAEAKNLNLLTLYESRIGRRFDRTLADLRKLQAERKAALAEAIEEAALLSHHARSKGETYNPAEAFEARDFEFSAVEIGRMVDRWLRLQEAKKFAAETRKPLRKAA